nr:hypothetical protein [Bacteroidota bacterium]
IGTTSPSELLEINGNLKVNNNAIIAHADIDQLSVSDELFMTNSDISGINKLIGYNNSLTIQNNYYGNAKMTFSSNGNIGIGMNDPAHKLDINGNIHINGSFYSGSDIQNLNIGKAIYGPGLLYGTGYIGFNAARILENEWQTQSDGANNGAALIFGTVAGDIVFTCLPSTFTGTGQSFTSAQIKDSTKMRLTHDGKLLVREVGVRTNIWYDHVFYEDFKLPSLSDVEDFIRKNNHLPDVPSEKEVMENGFNLGEMEGILLQKIEELTLYVIEQQKLLNSQQTKIDQLQSIIENQDNINTYNE